MKDESQETYWRYLVPLVSFAGWVLWAVYYALTHMSLTTFLHPTTYLDVLAGLGFVVGAAFVLACVHECRHVIAAPVLHAFALIDRAELRIRGVGPRVGTGQLSEVRGGELSATKEE